jgi:hypothetical protein
MKRLLRFILSLFISNKKGLELKESQPRSIQVPIDPLKEPVKEPLKELPKATTKKDEYKAPSDIYIPSKASNILDRFLEDAKSISRTANFGAYVDWSKPASQHRFFLVDLHKGEIIYSWWTSHGQGSGNLSHAREFSNVPDSHKSVLGRLKTAQTYRSSKFGRALRLLGLDEGINDKVFSRAIVMHRSDYVTEQYIMLHGFPGRSWGCPTLDPKRADWVIDKLVGGSPLILYK